MNQKILDPQVRDLAQRLLAYEVASVKVSEENTLAVFRVSERLRRPLSTLAGTSGFSALLARALVLTKADLPFFGAVHVKPDGSLGGLNGIAGDQAAEAGAILIAQLIGLLFAFIGADLTVRLVLTEWPNLPAPFAEFPRESNHDPTK